MEVNTDMSKIEKALAKVIKESKFVTHDLNSKNLQELEK